MTFYLYMLTLPDGRAYIGAAKNPRVRFMEHCRGRFFVGEEIRKTGRENVTFCILACGLRDYIFGLEEKAIAVFNTRYPSGLNLASGGFGGRNPLPSTRLKVSLARTGQKKSVETKLRMSKAQRGRVTSEETKAKLAEANNGKVTPETVRAKISAALIGRAKPPGFAEHLREINLGKTRSLESRQKQAATKRGQPWSEARRTAQESVCPVPHDPSTGRFLASAGK